VKEKNLILKAQKGERSAQRDLYHSYSRDWFSICLRYHQNKSDAEDALQNALIKIFGQIKQFNPDLGSFGAWSAKVVVNENLLLIKKRTLSYELNEVEEKFDEPEENSSYNGLSSEALTLMIQELPAGYRTVFNLYVLEGYTHQEISEILKINLGTSKSQLSKAKLMLRKRIESVMLNSKVS